MTNRQDRSAGPLAWLVAAVLGLGIWLLHDGARTEHPPQPNAGDALVAAPDPAAAPRRPVRPLPVSPPVRIRIPAIGVDAPVRPLGLDGAGRVAVPSLGTPGVAGWYRGSTTPGAAGNAVIDGHVDTDRGPAVFYGLGALHRGAAIEVDRRDGWAAVFTVTAVEVYPKHGFPDRRVYGPTWDAELRVITCGGPYSRSRGYLDNVVVYARLTRTHRARHASGARG